MLGSVTLVRNLQRRPGYRWRWHCGDCSHSVWTRTWSWGESAGQSVYEVVKLLLATSHHPPPRGCGDCVCVLTALHATYYNFFLVGSTQSKLALNASSWFFVYFASCYVLAFCYVWEKLERLWYRFISSYDGVLQYCHVSRVWSWHQDSWVVVVCCVTTS